eukprot:983791_1
MQLLLTRLHIVPCLVIIIGYALVFILYKDIISGKDPIIPMADTIQHTYQVVHAPTKHESKVIICVVAGRRSAVDDFAFLLKSILIFSKGIDTIQFNIITGHNSSLPLIHLFENTLINGHLNDFNIEYRLREINATYLIRKADEIQFDINFHHSKLYGFCKLFIFEIFPELINSKIIFVDIDMVMIGNIKYLYGEFDKMQDDEAVFWLFAEEVKHTINTGVFLWDLKKMHQLLDIASDSNLYTNILKAGIEFDKMQDDEAVFWLFAEEVKHTINTGVFLWDLKKMHQLLDIASDSNLYTNILKAGIETHSTCYKQLDDDRYLFRTHEFSQANISHLYHCKWGDQSIVNGIWRHEKYTQYFGELNISWNLGKCVQHQNYQSRTDLFLGALHFNCYPSTNAFAKDSRKNRKYEDINTIIRFIKDYQWKWLRLGHGNVTRLD